MSAQRCIERGKDVQELFDIVSEDLSQILECSEATLFILESGSDGAHLWTSKRNEPVVEFGVGALGRSAQDGEIRLAMANTHTNKVSVETKMESDGASNYQEAHLYVPLLTEEHSLGVLRLRCDANRLSSIKKRNYVKDISASLARVLSSCLARQNVLCHFSKVTEMITVRAKRIGMVESEFASFAYDVGSEVAKLLSCEMCTICLVDSEQRPIFSQPQARSNGDIISRDAIIHVIESKDDLLLSDECDITAFDRTGHIRSMLCVPIISKDQGLKQGHVSIVLQAINKAQFGFSESELVMLKIIGEHLHCIQDSAGRYEQLSSHYEQRYDNLIKLFDLFGNVRSVEHGTALELANGLGVASLILGAERVSLYVLDSSSSKYSCLNARHTEGQRDHEWHPTSRGIAGYCISTKQCLRVDSVRAHHKFDAGIDEPDGKRVTSALYCPIVANDGTPLGAIQVAHKRGDESREAHSFSEEDERLLQVFSRAIASLLMAEKLLLSARLENTVLKGKCKESVREIEALQADTKWYTDRALIIEKLALPSTDEKALETELVVALSATVHDILGGAECAVYIADYNQMHFALHRLGLETEQVSMSDYLLQELMKERQPVFLKDARTILGAQFYAEDLILAPLIATKCSNDALHTDDRDAIDAPLLGAIAFFNGKDKPLSKSNIKSCELICSRFTHVFSIARTIGGFERDLCKVRGQKQDSEARAGKLERDLLFATQILRIHESLDILGQFSSFCTLLQNATLSAFSLEHSMLYTLFRESNEVHAHATDGTHLVTTTGKGIVGTILESDKISCTNNLRADRNFDHDVDGFAHDCKDGKWFVFSPIKNCEGTILAVMFFVFSTEEDFVLSLQDKLSEFSSAIAMDVCAAVLNADNVLAQKNLINDVQTIQRKYKELSQAKGDTQRLLECSRRIHEAKYLDEIIECVRKIGWDLFGAQHAVLYLINWERGMLVSNDNQSTAQIEIPIGEGFVGEAASTGDPILLKADDDSLQGHWARDLLCLPIFGYNTDDVTQLPSRGQSESLRNGLNLSSQSHSDKVIGVLQIANKCTGSLDEMDMEVALGLADQLSISIHSASAHSE